VIFPSNIIKTPKRWSIEKEINVLKKEKKQEEEEKKSSKSLFK
jgi:hypothetical protein